MVMTGGGGLRRRHGASDQAFNLRRHERQHNQHPKFSPDTHPISLSIAERHSLPATLQWYFMPCLIVMIGLAFPRVAIVILFFFSTFLERAYHSLLLLALGFVFLPLTTIVYAWIVNGRHPLDGIYLAALILAALLDLGIVGHGEYHRRRAD